MHDQEGHSTCSSSGLPALCMFSGGSHMLYPLSYLVLVLQCQANNKEYILFWLRVDPNLRNNRIPHFVLSFFKFYQIMTHALEFSSISFFPSSSSSFFFFLSSSFPPSSPSPPSSLFSQNTRNSSYQYVSCTIVHADLFSRFSQRGCYDIRQKHIIL